jgi:SAM-dependent methyltransferase
MPHPTMTDEVSPQTALNGMLSAYRVAQSIFVVTTLGIPDLLRGGPKSCDELARSTGADPRALSRVLRFLTRERIFTEDDQGRFASTPLADLLRTDVPGSARAQAIIVGELWWRAWGELLYSVRTGKTAFEHAYGMKFYDYLAQHAHAAHLFSAVMVATTKLDAEAIIAAYDFSGMKTIVDVGGAHGALVAAILKAYPQARGILFDLPNALHGARALLNGEGVGERCDVVPGNFLELIPRGGDAYIFKSVFTDWDDTCSLAILKNCHRVLRPQARLLIVDPLSSPGLDLSALILTAGHVRAEAEYRGLLASAGFKVTRIIPTRSDAHYSIIEAVRA